MSAATLLIKAASLNQNMLGQGIRSIKGLVPKVVDAGTAAVHGLGDIGQGLGSLAGVDPELARAAAQAAGVGTALYAGKAVKDQTQQKIDNLRYQLQGGPVYY